MDHLRWPDLLVIGATKAGTTAPFSAVCRHPNVYRPAIKEPSYFSFTKDKSSFTGPGRGKLNRYFTSSRNQYPSICNPCPDRQIAGDLSTGYLANESAPGCAKKSIPGAKIIAILRHPVEQAFSMYLHLLHIGREPCQSFEAAWNDSERRIAQRWRYDMIYDRPGFYARHLSRWLKHFKRKQILILFFEDWRDQPTKVLTNIWQHLNLPPIENPLITRENVSSRQPHWAWLHHRMTDHDNPLRLMAQRSLPLWARDAVTGAVQSLNLRPGPQLDPELRARLARTYHNDLTELEVLTGRDLSHWRS
jgi:hypothetical protein